MSMSCFVRDRVEPNETFLRRTKSSRPLTLPVGPKNLLRRISEFPQIQLSEACSYRPIKSGGCPPGVTIHLALLCLFFSKVLDQHYKVHYALYRAKTSHTKRRSCNRCGEFDTPVITIEGASRPFKRKIINKRVFFVFFYCTLRKLLGCRLHFNATVTVKWERKTYSRFIQAVVQSMLDKIR